MSLLWVLFTTLVVSCFRGQVLLLHFPVYIDNGSGYFSCLNYSAVIDIYRAGPCMKCHHTQGHRAISCSFGQAAVWPWRQRSFWLNQHDCRQWESIRKPGKRWSVRDLLHVGLLQSRTTVFFPLLRSFSMCRSRGSDSAFWEQLALKRIFF